MSRHHAAIAAAALTLAIAGCQGPTNLQPGVKPPPISNGGAGVISTGGGNAVGRQAAPVVAPGTPATSGGGVISTGGGNVIATGGGNLVPDAIALDLPASLRASSTAYEVLAEPLPVGRMLKETVGGYRKITQVVREILKAVKKHELPLDKPITIDTPDQGQLTVLVEKNGERGLVSIGAGDSAKGANQLVGIAYEPGKRAGTAVFRPNTIKDDGIAALKTTFDLTARTATCDILLDQRARTRDRELSHVTMAFDGRQQDTRTFRVQIAAGVLKLDKTTDTGEFHYLANCVEGVGAVVAFGLQTQATQDKFVWIPNDGNFLQSPLPRDFYLGANGEELTPAEAPDALKALIPTETDRLRAPSRPDEADPFSGKDFGFPE